MKKQEWKYFFIFFVQNLFYTVIILKFFFPTYFETNDDFGMGCILAGAYGDNYRQCLVFSNVILGYILKFITGLIPVFNWYVVFQYVFVIIAISALVKLIAIKGNIKLACCVNLLSWFVFVFNFIRGIQFTRTAGFMMIAGFLCLWSFIVNDSKFDLWMGVLLFVYGIMLRIDSIYLILPFAILIVVYSMMNTSNDIKKMIFTILGVAILAIVLTAFDKLYYLSDAGWKDYNSYNEVRALVMDYPFPDYEENLSAYQENGFSYNDILMLDNWIFDDNNVFDTNRLKSLSVIQKAEYENAFDMALLVEECNGVLFWVWLLLLLCCIGNSNKKIQLFGVLVGIVTIMYISVFIYMGRVVERVNHVIWLSAIVSYIYMLLDNCDVHKLLPKISEKKIYISTILILLLSLIIYYVLVFRDFNYNNFYNNDEIVAVEYFSNDNDNIYVCNTLDFLNTCFVCKPYASISSGYMRNVITTGNWLCNSPSYKSSLSDKGIKNVLEDIVLKDNVFFVQSKEKTLDVLLTYYKEHYGYDCDYELIEEGYVFNVYKINYK
ncbi:MAG: hypothetical protein IJ232_01030 [Lachnospiraceae bacterium]|nr:hypothetical protein [Lachnospiraceae bacterium]